MSMWHRRFGQSIGADQTHTETLIQTARRRFWPQRIARESSQSSEAMTGLSESRNYLGSGNPLQWSADLGPGILDITDEQIWNELYSW